MGVFRVFMVPVSRSTHLVHISITVYDCIYVSPRGFFNNEGCTGCGGWDFAGVSTCGCEGVGMHACKLRCELRF